MRVGWHSVTNTNDSQMSDIQHRSDGADIKIIFFTGYVSIPVECKKLLSQIKGLAIFMNNIWILVCLEAQSD